MSEFRNDEARRSAAAENLARRKEELRGSRKRSPKKPERSGGSITLPWRKLAVVILLVALLILICFGVKHLLAGAGKDRASDKIVIGLKGSSVQIVLQGEPYIENGAFAIDRSIGAVDESEIKVKGKVKTDEPGDYTVEYSVKTENGRAKAVRTVRVLAEEEFGDRASNVPVLMYHWVYTASDKPDSLDGNWIQDTVLDEQMAYLEENEFYFPGWKELRAWVDGKISLPAKCTVVTFDDGRQNFLRTGVPVLERHHLPVTSFMICGGKSDGAGKIKEFASPYVDFESHTYDMHQQGNTSGHKGIVGDMSKEEILADMAKAREVTGNNDAIAYPYGDYTDEMLEAVSEQGMQCGFTVEYDRVKQGQDPLKLPRIRVLGTESFSTW